MKTCSTCHIEKPISEFLADARFSDGNQSWCLVYRTEKSKITTKHRYAHNRKQRLLKDVKYRERNIVPLRSKLVCGLHWEGNLQLLTKAENIRKKNYSWQNMWEMP